MRICPSEQFRLRTPAETFPGEAASKHSFLFLVRWPLPANLVRPLLREPLSLCLTLNTPLMERGRQGRRERGGGKILSVHTRRGACATASCHRGMRSLFLVIALDVGSYLVGGVCRTPLGLGDPPTPGPASLGRHCRSRVPSTAARPHLAPRLTLSPAEHKQGFER